MSMNISGGPGSKPSVPFDESRDVKKNMGQGVSDQKITDVVMHTG